MANNLIVIESGQLNTYTLDDKRSWQVGRFSKGNTADIQLYSLTVGRKHGVFHNMNGIWYYVDSYGKNGTIYNQTHLKTGYNGRAKPIMLNHGDIFVFGVSETAKEHNCRPVWAMYSTKQYEGKWRVTDSKGMTQFTFYNADKNTKLEKPVIGTVVELSGGMAIYMGDITYLIGDMNLKAN